MAQPLTATLEAEQWDYIGGLLGTAAQGHQAELSKLQPILNSLRQQLAPKPPVQNGKPAAGQVVEAVPVPPST